MLKSWSIENFKPIVNSGDLKLAPITILAGKNSSGKSSLLQSILMIAQTLSNQNRDSALFINGKFTKLRTFEDILSDYTQLNNIKITFETEDEEFSPASFKLSRQTVEVIFSSPYSSETNISDIENYKKLHEIVAEDISIESLVELEGRTYNPYDDPEINDYSYSDEFRIAVKKVPNDDLKSNLGNGVIKIWKREPSFLGTIKYESYHYPDPPSITSYFTGIQAILFHFLPDLLIVLEENKKNLGREDENHLLSGENDKSKSDIISLNREIIERIKQITDFFVNRLYYLSSLRADPDTIEQEFSMKVNIEDIGLKGDFAASVYNANQNEVLEWYNPYSKQLEQGTLKVALDIWVRYLGVAQQITAEVINFAGINWKLVLREGQKERRLPEVGFGLSQILPLLVMGLLSPKNSLLIIERPELHLHPNVQALLGDFFIGISKCHKQCLIETHSENIVSQLRYHIVEAGGQDKSDCIIYFVDQDEKGAAKFEEIEISPNGNILNWPGGFFDETMHQESRITAASIRKRAKNGD